MHFKKLLPLTLGALALAQSLTNAIAVNNASLSALSSTFISSLSLLRAYIFQVYSQPKR